MTDTMLNEPHVGETALKQPGRARAVFSTEDFRLLREAVVAHLRTPAVQDGTDSIKFGNLYHRLGRLG